jgi:RHS repeat-associated protein
MDSEHHRRNRAGRISSFSRLALWASPVVIAAALSAHALPGPAQPALPKAPAQVAMPAPPALRIVPGMEEPLVATGPVSAQESRELDAALTIFRGAPARAGAGGDFDDYARPLLAFVAAHPKSNWDAALYTDLGLGYYHAGYYSRAFAAYERAWSLGRDATTPQARLMVDRAVGELAKMHARVGHAAELEALLKDIGKRPIGGPATELIQGAREGLWTFKNNPGEGYLCGPNALKNVLLTLKATPEQVKTAEDARSGSHGFSLTQLAALADKTGLKYTLIKRTPGQPIPVPSIVHWKVHHYAAVTGMQDGLYHVEDPTFGNAGGLLVTAKAIDEESSGYFLVPAQAAAKPSWRSIAAGSPEAGAVYGMGTTLQDAAGAEQSCDAKAKNHVLDSGLPADSHPTAPPMCQSDSHLMSVNLNLTDTPVGYAPQKGSTPIYTSLTYNAREDMLPATFAFSNAGPKWSFSWLSYVQDDPAHAGPSVTRAAGGGGGYSYVGTYFTGTGQGVWTAETTDNSTLFRIPITGAVTSYEHRMLDGSKEVFALSDGAATFPRKMFLTSVVDAQGNVTTLNYDASFRLTSVVDAMGRSTGFTYGLTAAPLLVTRITDPFGRASQLTYDTSGRLASITDPVGITSSFTYSTAEPGFISTLTTPYGASTFSDTPNASDAPETATRSLTLTDPLGNTEFLYFYQNAAVTPASEPTAALPAGILNDNGLLQWRNTYRWDKHAFALGVTTSGGAVTSEDFGKATILHWLHDPFYTAATTARGIGSIKRPLENRLWINHPGQGVGYQNAGHDVPAAVGRVLDDGTSQAPRWSYTGPGVLSAAQDARGRYTQYNYAANLIDLGSVWHNKSNPAFGCGTTACNDVLAAFTYNAIHEPLTYTDAAGKVWHFTYNTAGQRTTMTDPATGVTTWNYDGVGRISNIVNALTHTAVSYTYDSADRVLTKTDSEGYVLTYGYDNLDRITSVTYPDGTTELNDYTFQSGPNAGTASLELRKHTDRLGRVTTYDYDAAQRMISKTEPTSGAATRTTRYDYYENGVLKDITDADGNVTHWDIDLESRPTKKTYAFGTASAQAETYTYENTTSRLKSITDADGQTKTFTYAIDDKITAIAYTGSINPTPNVTFAYDNIYPRMTTMTDGIGTTSLTYTAVATNGGLQIASIDGPFANDVIATTYDTMGRLAGRTVTGGNETFAYDLLSRLTSHVTPLGTFTDTYLGQTAQTATRSLTGTAIATTWGYDTNTNDRRLISIANPGTTRSYALNYLDPSTSAINPYDIMGTTDTAAAGHPFATQTHSYAYDLSDRLLTAAQSFPGNNTYAYDNLDNATTVTDFTGTTNPVYNPLNQIQNFFTNSYTYDNNGNTLSDGTRNYKWDAENRLIEIDYVGSTAKSQFSYDGMGHRTVDVETSAAGGVTTTRYLWCGSRICQTRDGTDTVLRRDLPEGEYNVTAAQKLLYMQDQLGSVRDVLDASTGALVQSYDYSPYGSVSRAAGSTPTDYQYAGLMAHLASGLYLSMTRAYDPVAPHWLNRDPIREAGGRNQYDYTNANPINEADWRGLCSNPKNCNSVQEQPNYSTSAPNPPPVQEQSLPPLQQAPAMATPAPTPQYWNEGPPKFTNPHYGDPGNFDGPNGENISPLIPYPVPNPNVDPLGSQESAPWCPVDPQYKFRKKRQDL